MKLFIVSGRSGSGKTTALNVFEDLGLYCVDNLPIRLIPVLIRQIARENKLGPHYIAIGVDARNTPAQIEQLPEVVQRLQQQKVAFEIIYLDAADEVLLQRFSETRRRHPLASMTLSLAEAIAEEKRILDHIASQADLLIDTTRLSLPQLRELIRIRMGNISEDQGIALLFCSFGYKHGVPVDADVVFDVRCLPNPYWDNRLRHLTGLDKQVKQFFKEAPEVISMLQDITQYLDKWLPIFEANYRRYMTVAVGCTGGQHRSVYLVEQLLDRYKAKFNNVQLRHRQLN